MPKIPEQKSIDTYSPDVVNSTLNASPVLNSTIKTRATADPASLKEIGAVIMSNVSLQNEFLDTLANRIGLVIVTSKMYENPLRLLKRGIMEFGETIEEIFVTLAKPFHYDIDVASRELYKIEKPDVRTAFYVINYKEFYKATINEIEMQSAFLSYSGIANLIAKIVEQMYSGAEYDEFQVMMYMTAKHLLAGNVNETQIPTVNKANMTDITTIIKGLSNKMQFMKPTYNIAKVYNFSRPSDQYVLISSEYDASMNVNVLASAFNKSYADFLQQRILIDDFGSLDKDRLNLIFKDYPAGVYTEISDSDLQKLNQIPAMIIDKNWFTVYDNRNKFRENYNGQGDYWNYFYHQWKTMAISPFANATVFVPEGISLKAA